MRGLTFSFLFITLLGCTHGVTYSGGCQSDDSFDFVRTPYELFLTVAHATRSLLEVEPLDLPSQQD